MIYLNKKKEVSLLTVTILNILMLKVTLLLLMLNLNLSVTFAQNYTPFMKKSTTFFIAYNNLLIGSRFDSVMVSGSDSIFFSYHAFEDTLLSGSGASECNIYSRGKNWMGFGMRQKPNGEYLFANRFNDTISIRTLAGWNDTWLFMKTQDTLFLEAIVSSIEPMTVNDISDTVKVIILQMKNANGEPVASVLNGAECWLSKSNGLLKMPMFNYMPESYTSITRFNIPGHTSAWYQNDEVGDETDICKYESDAIHCTAKKIIGKIYSTDSSEVTYTMLTYGRSQFFNPPSFTEYFTTSSYVSSVSSDSTVLCSSAGMTDEAILDTLSGKGKTYRYHYDLCTQTIVSSPGDTYFHCEDEYYEIPFELWNYSYQVSYCGIVSLINYFGESNSPLNFTHQLVYYKKGEIECGNSIIVGVEEQPAKQFLLPAYPNPANEKVFIQLPEVIGMPSTLKVYNLTGMMVMQEKVGANQVVELNIGNLDPGIYQVIISGKKISYLSRFAKM